MKAIYFPLIPRDPQLQKEQRPSAVGITGSAIYIAGFFDALVRYSSFDTLYVPYYPSGRQDDPRASELFMQRPGRIQSLPEHRLKEMGRADQLVLTAPFQSLAGMLRIRRLLRRPRTPITAVIHSINSTHQMASMLELFLSPVESFDALVCSSTAGRQVIENFQRAIGTRLAAAGLRDVRSRVRTPVLPLGIDTADFGHGTADALRQKLRITAEHRVVLYFGRFSASSKADLLPLVVAFADIARANPAAVLVLAGDDTHFRMTDELLQFAAHLGCGDRVRVVPNPTRVERRELYALANIFVSLSDNLQETFGLSVVEAMAAGLPVIASDWDGYRDLVVHGETGYLVPTFMPEYPDVFDDLRGSGRMLAPDLLAATTVIDLDAVKRALDVLLRDDHHCRELGAAGQRRARAMYDWRHVVRSYEDLWAEVEADARSCETLVGSSVPDWTDWHYRGMFGHYGTGLIDVTGRVRITDAGQRWRRDTEMLARIAQPATWFNVADMERILELLMQTDDASLADVLASEAPPDEEETARTLSVVCRLMKYGLLASVAAESFRVVNMPAAISTGTTTDVSCARGAHV